MSGHNASQLTLGMLSLGEPCQPEFYGIRFVTHSGGGSWAQVVQPGSWVHLLGGSTCSVGAKFMNPGVGNPAGLGSVGSGSEVHVRSECWVLEFQKWEIQWGSGCLALVPWPA